MKFVTTLFALLLACSVLAQDGSGPAIRNMNGRGTNTTFVNATFTFLTNATERIYSVKAFGAVGDGKYANGCYATNGSVVIFCTNAPFVPSDSGKYIGIDFGGTNGTQNWLSGISNYISPTQVALSNAPAYSVTNKSATYGTDDSAAIQLAMAQITNGNTTVLFPDDSTNTGTIYIVARPLQDVGDYTNHHSSQLYTPNILPVNIQKSAVLTLKGASPQMGGSTSSDAYLKKAHGSMIVSLLPSGPDGINRGSVFDFRGTDATQPQAPTLSGFNQRYRINSLCVVVEDLWIRGAYNNNLDLMNMQGIMNSGIYRCTFDGGFDWPSFPAVGFPTLTNTIGFSLPQVYSDNRHPVEDTLVSYMHKGVIIGENAMFRGCQIFACLTAADFSQGGGNLISFYHCNFIIVSNMFANASTAVLLLVDGMNIQNDIITNWNLAIDPNDNFGGIISYTETSAQANLRTNVDKIIGTNTRLLPIENSNYSPPTFMRGVNMRSNLIVRGISNFRNNRSQWGSDVGGTGLTASTRKYQSFLFAQHGVATYNSSWGSVDALGANANYLNLGFDNLSGAFVSRGITDVRFWTAPNDSTPPSFRFAVTPAGDFQSFGGDYIGGHKTNTAAYSVTTNNFTANLYMTNNSTARATYSMSVALTAVLTGTAKMGLWVDDNGNGTWDSIPDVSLGNFAGSGDEFISVDVSPGGRVVATNLTTSVGGESAIIIPGTCRIVRK
jgi:hypothetical protein